MTALGVSEPYANGALLLETSDSGSDDGTLHCSEMFQGHPSLPGSRSAPGHPQAIGLDWHAAGAVLLPLAAFPSAANRFDGIDSQCRDCRREYRRRWRAEHPDLVAAYNERRRRPKTTRTCPECGEEFVGWANQIIRGRRRCRDKRYARLHPIEYAEKRRRYQARRRARIMSEGVPGK